MFQETHLAVLGPADSAVTAAILRSLNPAAFSRKTSRILRTGNLCCATVDLLPVWKDAVVAAVSLRHTLCRYTPEWWPDIARNAGPACSGISGRHRPESAHSADYAAAAGVAGCGMRGAQGCCDLTVGLSESTCIARRST